MARRLLIVCLVSVFVGTAFAQGGGFAPSNVTIPSGTRLDVRYRRISMGDGVNYQTIPITFGVTF